MAKVEQTGVVAVVRLVEEIPQTDKGVGAVADTTQAAVFLDAAILGDTQKYDPVYGALNRLIQLADSKGIAQGDVPCQGVAPTLDLLKKGAVNLGGASLGLVGLGVFIKRAFEDSLL